MGGETMATTFLEPADNKKHQLACMQIRQLANGTTDPGSECLNLSTTYTQQSLARISS